MLQKKMFAGALITVSAVALFSGCQQAAAPSKSPEEVLKDAKTKLAEVTSYNYEVALNADIKDSVSGNVKFDVTAGGGVDMKDTKDPKVTMKVDGSGNDDKGNGANGSFEMRLNKEALFFNLMKLELKGEGAEAIPAEAKAMFAKWWKITLPPGAFDQMTTTLPQGSSEEMTAEQKELKKAFEELEILTQPVFVGNETIKGENSYHYSITVDKKDLAKFVAKVGEMQGESLGETEMAQLETGLGELDLKGDVWVGQTSGVINQVTGSMSLKEDKDSGSIGFRVTLSDVNKPVAVSAPEGAEEFPVEEFLGPLMMGGAMGGASTYPAGDASGMMLDTGDLSGSGNMMDVGEVVAQ